MREGGEGGRGGSEGGRGGSEGGRGGSEGGRGGREGRSYNFDVAHNQSYIAKPHKDRLTSLSKMAAAEQT